MYAEPICITREAKTLLGMTVWNDTLCLSSLDVMDYSLLVGIDEETNELVVGIIGSCSFSVDSNKWLSTYT